MSEKAYICQVCNTALPPIRARVHCRSCPDYDSCADCHVTESVSGSHCMEHDYEVHMYGRPTLVKERNILNSKNTGDPSQAALPQTSSTAPIASNSQGILAPELYWGLLITPVKTPSPVFCRLITAIFAHFDATSTGVLQPSEFCALMLASGYSTEEFPPLRVSTNESASPADLHELDAWLANWIRSFPLDHRMATREFPPPPPIEPHNGRIRMRDEILHALMHPAAPVVPNGLPLLSRLGLEQYFTYLLLRDPANLCARLNHLLGTLPMLTDSETGRPFETRIIPRTCFPLIPDPEEEEKRRIIEMQQIEEARMRMEVNHAANLAMSTALSNVSGGWRTDSNGKRYYQEGYIR